MISRGLLDKIRSRNWSEIKNKWINNIPIINPVGSPSPCTLSDVFGFKENAEKASNLEKNNCIKVEIPGFREALFHEAIYWMHKASHSVLAAETHVNNGLLTWAAISSYQGAFFGIKGIMNLLGISLPDYNKKPVLVDIWPEPKKLSSKDRKRGIEPASEMELRKVGEILNHLGIWMIFQRLIRVSKIDIWPKQYIFFFKNLDESHFAWQRNKLLYQNNFWLEADMHDYIINKNYGLRANLIEVALDLKKETNDFSLLLSFIVLNAGYLLLDSFSEITNKLKDEVNLLAHRHLFYKLV